MDSTNAGNFASELIRLMVQHQTGLLPPNSLGNDDQARKAAQAIAAFRKELIAQLAQQQ